jgi:hypothetical protein
VRQQQTPWASPPTAATGSRRLGADVSSRQRDDAAPSVGSGVGGASSLPDTTPERVARIGYPHGGGAGAESPFSQLTSSSSVFNGSDVRRRGAFSAEEPHRRAYPRISPSVGGGGGSRRKRPSATLLFEPPQEQQPGWRRRHSYSRRFPASAEVRSMQFQPC